MKINFLFSQPLGNIDHTCFLSPNSWAKYTSASPPRPILGRNIPTRLRLAQFLGEIYLRVSASPNSWAEFTTTPPPRPILGRNTPLCLHSAQFLGEIYLRVSTSPNSWAKHTSKSHTTQNSLNSHHTPVKKPAT